MRISFYSFFSPEQPQWYSKLVSRAFLDFSTPEIDLVTEILNPLGEKFRKILQEIPGIDLNKANLWLTLFFGQIHHYSIARNSIQRTFGIPSYTPEFLEQVLSVISQASLMLLGLPIPDPDSEK